VCRLSKLPDGAEAEFALLVSDLWQNRGLGTQMLARVLDVARAEKVTHVSADILPENAEMQRVAQKAGFKLTRDLAEGTVRAEIGL
jgi:acetyltransferase